MNEQEKQDYLRGYKKAKAEGEPFYPNAVFKDALVGLTLFLILVALAAFVGAPLEARANPSDASYIPRPEWYFLFLYELLKFFPGNLVVLGVIVFPAVVFTTLFLLPWLDRSPHRHPRKRPMVMILLGVAWVVIISFTTVALLNEPEPAEALPALTGVNTGAEEAVPGEALFQAQCAGCHGEFGEGGPNPALLGSVIPPISSGEFLSAFTDDTLFNIVTHGLPERGMSAFGQQSGGPLEPGDIELVIQYIRNWETSPPVVAAYIPPTPAVPDGATLYATTCAACHGLYGEGGVAPAMTSADFSGRDSQATLHAADTAASADDISTGLLAQIDGLNGADFEAVLTYAAGLAGSTVSVSGASAEQGDPANGAVLFTGWCENCHGPEGVTEVGPEGKIITDPAFLASVDDATMLEAINNGFPEPDDMPDFQSILSTQEISDLLAWLRSHE